MLLVVHIPKTAGTSLCLALGEHCPVAKHGAYTCPEQISGLVRESLARIFTGPAEQYRESLDLISQHFSHNFALKRWNLGPKGRGLRLATELRPDVHEHFCELNQAVAAIYRDARANLLQHSRRALVRENSTPLRDPLIIGAD